MNISKNKNNKNKNKNNNNNNNNDNNNNKFVTCWTAYMRKRSKSAKDMKCKKRRSNIFASYLLGYYSSNSNWGFKLFIANCFVNAKGLQNKYQEKLIYH